MNHVQDENTFYLRQYELEQDALQSRYLESLPERYSEIIDYSVDILEGLVDDDTYHLVFGDYYEEDRDEYNSYIMATIEEWLAGETEDWDVDDYDVIKSLARKALLVGCEELFGDSLYSHAQDGLWSIEGMVRELVGV